MSKIIWIGMGIIIGLAIAYFFLWGKPYSILESKYNQLNQDYEALNQNYLTLQQEHNALKSECGEVLKKYQACVGREDFFTWVERFNTLAGLAKFIGLI